MAEAETVTAPSMADMVAGATGGVNRLGNQAATTNVSGLVTQLGGIFELLNSQGVFANNPQLRQQFDALQASINKSTKGKTKKLTTAQSRLTDAQSQKTDIETQLASGSLSDKDRQKLQKRLTKLDANIAKYQKTTGTLSTEINNQYGRLENWESENLPGAATGADMLREQFPELQRTLDEAAPYLDRMGQPGATGERLMQALGQGYTANTISADRVTAPRLGDFGRATSRDISAGQVGAGALGQSLMSRAQQMAQSQGRLSPEANRDAVQAARQAFAARGLGTSAGSAAAELLNRDQYSRQRMFQDLGFAQGVQAQDLGRQFQNVGNQLTAAQSNQSASMQAELANLQARYNAAVQQGNWEQAAAFQNQSANLQAAVANEEARRLGTQMNAGMLGQAFTYDRMINQEGLAAAMQRGQLASAANPANMMLSMYGSGQPVGSQALGPATSLASNWAEMNLAAQGFNANAAASNRISDQNYRAAQMAAGATNNAATMGMIGAGAGAAIGIGVLAI